MANLVGQDGLIQPVAGVANAAVDEVHALLEVLSHQLGVSGVVHGVTELGEEIGFGDIGEPSRDDAGPNLLTDVLNVPLDVLNGNADNVLQNIGQDLTNIVRDIGTLLDTVVLGNTYLGNDPVNPIPEIIQGLGGSLQNGPLLSLGNSNGILDGSAGDLSQSGSGHLVDIDVGPEQAGGGLVVDLLAAAGAGPAHGAEVNVIDVGPTGPNLLDLNLLSEASLPVIGGGADGLIGNVLGGDLLGGGSSAVTDSIHAVTGGILDEGFLGGLDLSHVLGGDGLLLSGLQTAA